MRALNGVTAKSCRGARLHGGSADLIGCGVMGFQLPTPSVADSRGADVHDVHAEHRQRASQVHPDEASHRADHPAGFGNAPADRRSLVLTGLRRDRDGGLLQPLGGGVPDSCRMGARQPNVQAGCMTHRARHKETEDFLGSSIDVPGRDAVPGRGEFLEFLGLTLAAGAFVLFVVHPEAAEALVQSLVH